MADDIKIKYGSSGFERIRSELTEMERVGGESKKWFTPMSQGIKEVESATSSWFQRHQSAFGTGLNTVEIMAGSVIKLTAIVGTLSAVVGGAVTAAFMSWSMSVLKTRESFAQLEISMYGSLKSWEAVNKVSKFAKEYAAEYPAMYGDVMKAMQSMAFIPSLKPIVQSGDVQGMKEIMHVVQGLMTMRPEQGIGGSIWALREALAGNWRSLQYRFDVPIQSIARSAGMTMEQMKETPEAGLKALKEWINSFVGAETMEMSAKNLSIQLGNIKDKYDMWLDTLAKTGIYQKVVDYLLKINDFMDRLMKSERLQGLTKGINEFLEGIADKLAGVFTKGVDWERVTSWEGLKTALKQIGKNAFEEMRKVWDEWKAPLGNVLENALISAFEIGVKGLISFIPKAMESVAKTVGESFMKMTTEHPKEAGMMSAGAGAALGFKAGGPVGALFGGTAGFGVSTVASFMANPGENAAIVKEFWVGAVKDFGAKVFSPAWWKAQATDVVGFFKGKKEEAIAGAAGARAAVGGAKEEGGVSPGRFRQLEEASMKNLPKVMEFEPTLEKKMDYWTSRFGMESQIALAETRQRYTPIEERPIFQWLGGKMSDKDWALYREEDRLKEVKLQKLGELMTGQEELSFKQAEARRVEWEAGGRKGPEPGMVAPWGLLQSGYGEMFKLSLGKGDFGKAQEYMNKSLEAMINQQMKEQEIAIASNRYLALIEENTRKMGLGKPEEKKAEYGTGKYYISGVGAEIPASQNWTADELKNEVNKAMGIG